MSYFTGILGGVIGFTLCSYVLKHNKSWKNKATEDDLGGDFEWQSLCPDSAAYTAQSDQREDLPDEAGDDSAGDPRVSRLCVHCCRPEMGQRSGCVAVPCVSQDWKGEIEKSRPVGAAWGR